MFANDPNVVSVEDDGWLGVLLFVGPWLLIGVAVWTVCAYRMIMAMHAAVRDETPTPIPQGDQGGGASAPGEGARS